MDAVDQRGPAVGHFGELVFVVPERVGADPLIVHKVMRPAHVGDLGEPGHRNSQQRPHAVFDHHALRDFVRELAQNLETQIRRRDFREIAGVGKKLPALGDAGGNHLAAFQ